MVSDLVTRHYRWRQRSLVLSCHVQPGARCTELAGIHCNRLKIRLQAPAKDGQANAALINFLAHTFKVGKADVEIGQGHASRHKTVVVRRPGQLPASCEIDACDGIPK